MRDSVACGLNLTRWKKKKTKSRPDSLLKMVFVIWYVLVKHLFAICFGVDRCVAGNML